MKWQERWWLGLLGLIGIYQLPAVLEALVVGGPLLTYADLLWLLWFSYLIPEGAIRQ